MLIFEVDQFSEERNATTFPLGTNYHQNSQILCSECLLRNIYTALEHLASLMSRERQLTCAAKKNVILETRKGLNFRPVKTPFWDLQNGYLVR